MAVILFSAGSNSHGQLTTNTNQQDIHHFEEAARFLPLSSSSSRVVSSAAGGRHALFLTCHSELYGCGDGSQGQLPPSSYRIPPPPPDGDTHTALAQINYKKLILHSPHIDPQLQQTLVNKYRPVQVAACWETSFIVLSCHPELGPEESLIYDDHILAFGSNNLLVRGSAAPALLDHPSLPNLVELPSKSQHQSQTGRRTIRLHASCRHLIALVAHQGSMQLVGWGAARHGQLGPALTARSVTPCVLPLTFPSGPTTTFESVKIALGNQHTVVVCPTQIWCWGSNRHGQLPPSLHALPPADILELQASWNATFLILQQPNSPGHKRLLGYGSNSHGQLLSHDPSLTCLDRLILSSFSHLVSGSEHLLIANLLYDRHEVWGWGWNEHGNLGSDPALSTSLFKPIFRLQPSHKISHLLAGCATSFIFCSL
ncbi:hypothetical protein VP01_988g3 [Puccinia sorghi]|uniref:Uncharacterized protein n=1 Tax=Puccinia sorghi TaxID=27349 RepID=A0A0L6U7I1_9BASI|nr:hypothetical protein VP01_988g3 [Puccinia sorghi]